MKQMLSWTIAAAACLLPFSTNVSGQVAQEPQVQQAQPAPAPGPGGDSPAAALDAADSAASAADAARSASTSSTRDGAHPLTRDDLVTWLDGYMEYALKSADIAGAVVVVVKDGEFLAERGYGYSDVAARRPVDPETTLFRPGSVSKLFTWTAVMQLVERGEIDLDADVNRYLDFEIPARDGEPVTMRNIMQHTAGFEEQGKAVIMRDGDLVPAYDELLKAWIPERIFSPGTTPAYSNYATSLAGYIVQRVSGEPFDDYIERHIFAPLRMTRSTFRQPLPSELEPLMSKGYSRASEPARSFEFVGPAPAGSLSSPGVDMGRFMLAHLNDGELDGQRILQPRTVEMMHDSPTTIIPGLNRMQLGFFETNVNGRKVIAHLGDTADFHTSLHLFLDEDTGFYVSFNSAGREGASGNLRYALFHDFADRYFPGPPMPSALDAETQLEHASLMAGNWQVSRRSESNWAALLGLLGQTKIIVTADGKLSIPGLTTPGGGAREWIEVAPFTWQDPVTNDRLIAKLRDGQPYIWSFDMFSPFMVFTRPAWYANGAWLLPAAGIGLGILVLTILLWPIRARVRRHFGTALSLSRPDLRAYRASRWGVLAVVAVVLAWGIFLASAAQGDAVSGGGLDWLLILLQIFGIIALIAGILALAWNLVRTWSGTRDWKAKLWALLLLISAVLVAWAVWVAGLLYIGASF
jgi:CubicO group peptidase (beta-lactamase class C family)